MLLHDCIHSQNLQINVCNTTEVCFNLILNITFSCGYDRLNDCELANSWSANGLCVFFHAVCSTDRESSGSGSGSGSGDGFPAPTLEQVMCFFQRANESDSPLVDACGTSNLTTVSTKTFMCIIIFIHKTCSLMCVTLPMCASTPLWTLLSHVDTSISVMVSK